jgi:2-amino-4-hydroxy-6-hydroxymethyldihydropteridine diphosphokinase
MQHPPANHLAYFSLGSNLGDRVRNLDLARELMAVGMGTVKTQSGYYISPPWGYRSDHDFYNCCLALRTALDPLALLEEAQKVEMEMGRIRQEGALPGLNREYRDRIIDIDLLMVDDLIMDLPRLILPHPGMTGRGFVLVPMTEIAPDLVHPVSGITMSGLLERCPDPSKVIPV